MALPPPPIALPRRKDYTKTPQELVTEFWDKYFTKKPGKVTSIFPRSLYATLLPPVLPRDGTHSARNAAESYEVAAKQCRERVQRIIRECNRTNEKFTDPDFDIESDWNSGSLNCLNGLVRVDPFAAQEYQEGGVEAEAALVTRGTPGGPILPEEGNAHNKGGEGRGGKGGVRSSASREHGVKCGEQYSPGSIHRVDWIFESPKFTVDGYSSSDIKQGANGDCWWLAAVATIAHRKDLMNKVCVARDEEIGVYGFVFYRDGEWISTVVDDNLYLQYADFDYYGDQYDSTGKRAREFRKRYQTGSEALYFAHCDDPNETWLPLLEKAYSKVHGDYEACSGGYPGEAVEDMTGGVTTTVAANRVLRKDKLWRELINADGEFVFALSALGTGWDWVKGGLALGHAYSILKATEEVDEDGKKVRLVQVRNPWGERASNGIGEWNGPWSDGSKEWTPYWLKKLNHTFGDDGVFWMSYEDVLETFMFLHRTRLFDEKWTVVQQWTAVNVGWVSGYLNKKFIVEITKAGTVVIVLQQLDERYFVGLEGQYQFSLHFLLREVGSPAEEHICRVRPVHDWENRSVSCEVDLEPGKYEVLPMIVATRDETKQMVDDVVRDWADKNPTKLRQVGMQYDLAHAKGGIPDEDEIIFKKKEAEKKKQEEKKRKEKEKKEKKKAKKLRDKEKAKRQRTTVTVESANVESVEIKLSEKPAAEEAKEDSKDEDKDEKFEDAVDTKTEETPAPAPVPVPQPVKETEKKEEAKKEDTAPKSEKPSANSTPGIPTPQSTVKGEEEKPAEEEEEEEEEEDEEEEEEKPEEAPPVVDDDGRAPWNAVCVMGLRVYAKDPEVKVSLAEPKSEEEAASLVVDAKAVGSTM